MISGVPGGKITERRVLFSTAWFEVVSKTMEGQGANDEPYYSIRPRDYVTVIATTETGQFILVEQYRPAVEAVTLELPSGLVDPGEEPETSANRELLEETGYAAGDLKLMGVLLPDTGRLENRVWCYFSDAAIRQTEVVEEGVKTVLYSQAELFRAVAEGRLAHALNLAAVLLAVSQGRMSAPGAVPEHRP